MDRTIEHDDIRLLIWLACVCGKTVSLPPSLAAMYIYRKIHRNSLEQGMYLIHILHGVLCGWLMVKGH